MAKSTPEKDTLGAGFHVVAPSETAAVVFNQVVQRAAELYAQDLAVRTNLDQPSRLTAYDEFIKDLGQRRRTPLLMVWTRDKKPKQDLCLPDDWGCCAGPAPHDPRGGD